MNLICEECGARVPEELIQEVKQGETVFCENCGAKITQEVLPDQAKDSQSSQKNKKQTPQIEKAYNIQNNEAPRFQRVQISNQYSPLYSPRAKRHGFLTKIKSYFLRLKFKIKRFFYGKRSGSTRGKKGHGRGHHRGGR